MKLLKYFTGDWYADNAIKTSYLDEIKFSQQIFWKDFFKFFLYIFRPIFLISFIN